MESIILLKNLAEWYCAMRRARRIASLLPWTLHYEYNAYTFPHRITYLMIWFSTSKSQINKKKKLMTLLPGTRTQACCAANISLWGKLFFYFNYFIFYFARWFCITNRGISIIDFWNINKRRESTMTMTMSTT